MTIDKVSDNKIICNGQISLFASSLNMSNYDFSLFARELLKKNENDSSNPFNTDNAGKVL